MITSIKKTATIIIDLQNEFFYKSGILGDKYLSTDIFSVVEDVVNRTRKNNNMVIWVKSIYDWKVKPAPKNHCLINKSLNNDYLRSSHFHKKICCAPNTFGVELHNEIKKLMHKDDIVVIKNWYSAFTDTDLHDILSKNNIEKIFIGGVITHICIQSSVCDAHSLGYDVCLLNDCVNAADKKRESESLEYMRKYVKILPSCEAFSEVI